MPFRLKAFVARFGTAVAAALVFLFFTAGADHFSTAANLLAIAKQVSPIAILGLGFSLALTGAELDLSFASVASLAAIATGLCIRTGAHPSIAALAGLGTGLGFGLLNGMVVTRLKVPSLIATLALGAIANGCAFWLTDGISIVGRWPVAFTSLGRGSTGGVPNLVLWMAAAALFTSLFLKQTRIGFHLVATGEAEDAAALAGIGTRGMKVLGLALSGLTAGLAAVLLSASLSSATPGMASDYLLTAIAAVTLGMTMFEPGRPNVPGTLVGALTIGMLSNGLVLLGAPYYVQDICLGAIIIASVALSASVLTRSAFRV